ncbi:MAG: hypothetical protein AAF846_29220 [Chloroflexota bacterium]
MRKLIILITMMLIAIVALPASAQEEPNTNWLSALLGEAEINERLYYRVPLARDYEATVHGNRLQGIGHLEFNIVDSDGEALSADNSVDLTVTYDASWEENGEAYSIFQQEDYSATYQDGSFYIADINWEYQGGYDLNLNIDGADYYLYLYVPPAKPDATTTFIGANIAIPFGFLIVMLGAYRVFNVQFLPENRRQGSQAK